MRTFGLAAALFVVLSAPARGDSVTIEGEVIYIDVEVGCWALDDVWTGTRFELHGGDPDLYQPGIWVVIQGILHPDWYTTCMVGVPIEVVTYQVGDPWWWPPQWFQVTPDEPTSADPLTISLGGEWPHSCIPNGSALEVVGDEVHFEVIVDYPPGTFCAQVITPWSLAEDVDPLPPGTYTVYVYVTGLGSPWPPPDPTPLITFTVAQAGDVDGDNDVDLSDLAALLAAYGRCIGDPRYDPAADFDHGGCVDVSDLSVLLAHYGAG